MGMSLTLIGLFARVDSRLISWSAFFLRKSAANDSGFLRVSVPPWWTCAFQCGRARRFN